MHPVPTEAWVSSSPGRVTLIPCMLHHLLVTDPSLSSHAVLRLLRIAIAIIALSRNTSRSPGDGQTFCP